MTETFWISQYVLTKGIFSVQAKRTSFDSMISVDNFKEVYHKPHWHETEEEAINQALKNIEAKRKSIAKQLAKLDKLEKQFKEKL